MSNSGRATKIQSSESKSSKLQLLGRGLLILMAATVFGCQPKNPGVTNPGETNPATDEGQGKPDPRPKTKDPAPLKSLIPSFAIDPINPTLKTTLVHSRLDVSMTDIPLEAALETLFRPLKVNLFYAKSARELIGGEQLRLNLKLKDVSAYSALRHIDAQFSELLFHFNEGVIHVNTVESYKAPIKLGLYDVSILVKSYEHAQAIQEKAEQEAAAKAPKKAKEKVDPDDDSSSCLGIEPVLEVFESLLSNAKGEGHTYSLHNSLFHMRGNQQEHKMLQQFIAAFKKNIRSSKGMLLHNFNGQAAINQANKTWGEKAVKALKKPMSAVTFNEAPFSQFVDYIRNKTQLNITISAEIDAEELTITMQLKNRTYKDALDWVLKDNKFAIIPFHEAFRIVAKGNGEDRQFQLKIYSVEDILYPQGKANPNLHPDRLTELLYNGTDDELWEDPASVRSYGGQLLIYQTEEVFVEIEKILKTIRAGMARKK
ncbi:MAG: hypothetical protein P1V97_26010 [Planctomycetota bacterium]|nr:hypothetical protein [Planctomycetota bacterium]